MKTGDPRATIERLARERGDGFAGLSALIGRNPAYVQQFVRRGTPARLAENDRAVLARHFGIDEALLGAPARAAAEGEVTVARYELAASAGPGALADEERAGDAIRFSERRARRMAGGDPGALSTIAVRGDSMEPTLAEGDEIIVNRSDAGERLRDGIYVLRIDEALIVKRVQVHPGTRRLTIASDNARYAAWEYVEREGLDVIGRVVAVIRPVG